MVLALGQRLGSPTLGLWLSAAAVVISIYYLISAWLPAPWALLGAARALAHPLMLAWNQGFWGGSVQTVGGTLLLGAASRACRSPRWNYGFLMGLGVAVLARPPR